MSDSTRYTNTDDDTGLGPGRESKPGKPRWVKVSLIIVLAVVVLMVVLALTGVFGAGHVPGPPAGGH
jgi:hypothetical protein